MRVISQVCLQAHSTLYSAKNIREHLGVLLLNTGNMPCFETLHRIKAQGIFVKVDMVSHTGMKLWGEVPCSVFISSIIPLFTQKLLLCGFFSICVTSINYTLSLLSSSYKEPFKIFNRCTILLHLHFHWLRTQK